MKFVELNEKEFQTFASSHEQESFFQTVGIAKLRESYGSKIYYLGVKEKNKIVAAAMFSVTKTFLGRYTFYAPRGYLIDYNNKELLAFFTKELKAFCKQRKGIMLKIDPNVIYQIRDNDGSVIPGNFRNDEVIKTLKELGYKHFGFNTDVINTQSRWNARLDLSIPYEELRKGFSKTTKKNIEATYKKGIQIRKGTSNDLESMEEILIETANRKKFSYRSLDYYKRMYKYLGDDMQIYIAYLDPDIYLSSTKDLFHEEEVNNQKIRDKMDHDNVGNKLKNQLDTSNRLLEKYQKEVEVATKFKEENPKGKDIGVLISLKSGLEYLTLYSGILVEYKRFTPKYAMYNEHILDAYKFGFPYVNFYGISGIFDPKNRYYGVFEIKKGFGVSVIELIGEFTYPLSFSYYIYTWLRKIKIFIRNLKYR